MWAALCLAGGGGCLQQQELVKRTQDLTAGLQRLGEEPLGMYLPTAWAEQYPRAREKSSGQNQVGSHLWALWEHKAHPA